jgi:sugar O-acyltransferase (sialic acid O-acetyltransferase NeuD family)
MIRRPLLVIGAGGFARETVAAVLARGDDSTYLLRGVLDDDPALSGTTVLGAPVLGPVGAVDDHPDVAVVICTGNPRDYASRARIVALLELDESRFATIAHPGVHLGAGTTVGHGSVLLANVVTTCDVQIGNHVSVMPQVTFTHDDVVEDFATLAAGVTLGGAVRVSEGAYLGARAVVREGVTVGAWSLLGMGSVLTRDLPARVVAYGSPAVIVRKADVRLGRAA